MSEVLKAIGLRKAFRERVVLSGLSIEVKPGSVVGLLGPNGAGKTTAFKIILGLLKQDAGSVQFGSSLDGLPLHRRARMGLGYLPQGPSVFRGMTVRDNLLAVLETLGKPDPQERADALLEQFGLRDLSSEKAKTLSGGERRRLEFARALCSEPSILLCDEPFAGVDPIAAMEIEQAIASLAKAEVGVLLTDHSVREAMRACDTISLLIDGRVLMSGPPKDLLESDQARRLYFGDA